MIFCIPSRTFGEYPKVRMSRSFSLLRTVIATGFACITSPSKVTRLGFSVLMGMGLLVSTWPPAGRAVTASVAATSKTAPPAHSILFECGDFEIASSIGMRKRSECVIERNLQRLQEPDVMRGHLELGRLLLFLQHVLVHLNAQRLQKSPVVRGDPGRRGFTLGQPDCGIELQNDVVSRGAHARNGPRDAL